MMQQGKINYRKRRIEKDIKELSNFHDNQKLSKINSFSWRILRSIVTGNKKISYQTQIKYMSEVLELLPNRFFDSTSYRQSSILLEECRLIVDNKKISSHLNNNIKKYLTKTKISSNGTWYRYTGLLSLDKGRLCLTSTFGDLIYLDEEFSDLLGKETSIGVKRND